MDHVFEVEDTDQFVLLKEDVKVLKKKATCVFCKKTGHSESQCYKKKPPPSSTSSNKNRNESAKEKKNFLERDQRKKFVYQMFAT